MAAPVAKPKTDVKLTVYAYSSTENGRTSRWGYVFPPGFKDPGGIPYSDPLEGMQVIARELRKAHQEAAKLRESKQKPAG